MSTTEVSPNDLGLVLINVPMYYDSEGFKLLAIINPIITWNEYYIMLSFAILATAVKWKEDIMMLFCPQSVEADK